MIRSWISKFRKRRDTSQAHAIIGVLTKEINDPIAAAKALGHVQWTVSGDKARGMMALGYQLRRVESRLFATAPLQIAGLAENAILALSLYNDDKIEKLVDYLTTHTSIGIGEPIKPYAVIDIEQLWIAEDRLVNSSLEYFGIVRDDAIVELYHRCVADGYAYRVAEELVEAFSAKATSN